MGVVGRYVVAWQLALMWRCSSLGLKARHLQMDRMMWGEGVADRRATASRIATRQAELGTRQVGDGLGRALYQFNTIEMPVNASAEYKCICVRMDKFTHSLSVDPGSRDSNTIAWGCFNDVISKSGWSQLEVGTIEDMEVPLATKAYAAGIVEGLLTAHRIGQFYQNVAALLEKDVGTGGAVSQVVDRVIRMSLVAWEEFAGGNATKEPMDDLPKQAWAALVQLRGIRDGNNFLARSTASSRQAKVEANAAGVPVKWLQKISAYQLMLANMHAEIPAIVGLYGRSEQAKLLDAFLQTNGSNGSASWPRWAAHQPHGSAIVRRTGTFGQPEDLLAGHVTVGEYGEMVRILKTYHLHFGGAVSDVTMTSYPGCVSSTDDYFISGAGFVAMSTSLSLPSQGEFAVPAATNEGLPSFLRAIMATRMSLKPRMWAKVYGFIAGIAGAKQWVVVDYSNFKEGQQIANDTVWMIESLPRVQRANDVSHILRAGGFFEAHGVPHFRDIRVIYGFPPEGPGSYEEARQSALIDKGPTMSTMVAAREMLGESQPSRDNQIPISVRYDLDPSRPIPAGAIDAKLTSKCLVAKLGLQARSGPPATPGGKHFHWLRPDTSAEIFPHWPHFGQPSNWNFPWVSATPGKLSNPLSTEMSECAPSY
jgi:hypothetical protein